MAHKKVCVLAKMLQNRALNNGAYGLVLVLEEITIASNLEAYLKMSCLRILDVLG